MVFDPNNNQNYLGDEADEDIQLGRVKCFNSVEELITELNSEEEEEE